MLKKIRNWIYKNIKGWQHPPCDCCDYRSRHSVCRNEALKANWELIKKMSRPSTMKNHEEK